jgi:seryl-tRNA synthetase
MQFNALNKEIGDKKKASKGQDKCEDLLAKSGEIKASREEKKLLAVELDKQRTNKLGLIGNVLSDKCPVFKDEENNGVLFQILKSMVKHLENYIITKLWIYLV